MKSTRKRLRFTFWLDLYKDDEFQLAELIEYLKDDRLFTRTIRDGLRLILDLREGRTEVLHELFPWVAEQHQPATGLLSEYEASLAYQLGQLEQKLLQSGQMITHELPATTRQLPPTKLDDLENDDRLNLTIEEAKTEQQIGWNLQLSMAKSNFGCTYLELPLAALEYGLEQGDFGVTPQIIEQKRAMIAEKAGKKPASLPPPKTKKEPEKGSAKQLAAADIELPTNHLDDLEVEW